MTAEPLRLSGSFRDPSGYVFFENGAPLRSVSLTYRRNYDLLASCGLLKELITAGLLIKHEELPPRDGRQEEYKVLRPEKIPFISYPYEWCFPSSGTQPLRCCAYSALLWNAG
jgi:hypothetical protein